MTNQFRLIKTDIFTKSVICLNKHLSCRLSRHIYNNTEGMEPHTGIKPFIPVFEPLPQLLLFIKMLFSSADEQQYGRYLIHNGQIFEHITLAFFIYRRSVYQYLSHSLTDVNMLIYPLYHYFFIDRLILSAYKVSVEIDIIIVERLNVRQRLIYIDIIHIKHILRKIYPALFQYAAFIQ